MQVCGRRSLRNGQKKEFETRVEKVGSKDSVRVLSLALPFSRPFPTWSQLSADPRQGGG